LVAGIDFLRASVSVWEIINADQFKERLRKDFTHLLSLK
jgi:hypothetical protein